MQALGRWIKRVETLISFSALSILVLSVLWGVLTRYVTERPAVWTTELSGILFTWVVFIGAMTASRDGRHIRVTLLIDRLSPPLRLAILKIGDLLVLCFLIYTAYLSVSMMQKGATRPSPVLDIPFSYVYLATTICFVGMSVISGLRLLKIIDIPKPVSAKELL